MRRLFLLVSAVSLTTLGIAIPGISHAPAAHAGTSLSPVCGPVPLGYSRCFAVQVTGVSQPYGVTAPSGYGPADFQSAYNLPSANKGNGQTVAIVDAFDDPTAESDLAKYRAYYGLPPCTTANGCFRKVDENGGTLYPTPDPDWSLEISLDLDMVSAVCPNCHILLVEAQTNLNSDLYTAVDTAAALGANEISNSYGGGEDPSQITDDSHFYHPGVAITASSGDSGYGVEYPAASQFVTAVGGTSLMRAPNTRRGWTETAWSGAGSGCSSYDPKPSWQKDAGCANRSVADVSADADPNTGAAILYAGNWLQVGGTSESSPIIAAVYALAGNSSKVTFGSYPYSHTAGLFDVVQGNNETTDTVTGEPQPCSPSYLCVAGPGYDGPTGLGTPNGTSAF